MTALSRLAKIISPQPRLPFANTFWLPGAIIIAEQFQPCRLNRPYMMLKSHNSLRSNQHSLGASLVDAWRIPLVFRLLHAAATAPFFLRSHVPMPKAAHENDNHTNRFECKTGRSRHAKIITDEQCAANSDEKPGKRLLPI